MAVLGMLQRQLIDMYCIQRCVVYLTGAGGGGGGTALCTLPLPFHVSPSSSPRPVVHVPQPGWMWQDVTKQQAKERAAARKQVAGQSTLDRFLSPSQEKQVQKQLAKTSNNAANLKSNLLFEKCKQDSKHAVAAVMKKQKGAGMQQPQAAAKRPLRQMKRLYPEDEAVQLDVLNISQSPVGKAPPRANLCKDDDADFQPAKRLKGRAQAGTKPLLQTGKISSANLGKGSSIAQECPAISLQSFSYSKEHSKKSKGQVICSSGLCDNVNNEASSAQPAVRTRSKTTYTGMY